MNDLVFSQHALVRWRERFAHLDPDSEWYLSRRPGKKIRRRIRERCLSVKQVGRQYHGLFYAVSPHGVIFVIGGRNNFVVTVMPLHDTREAA